MIEITCKDDKLLSAASYEAKKSPCRTKHGCVAVISGKIIATGHNHYRNPSSDGFVCESCTCHAEMDALRSIYRIINGRGHYKKNKRKNKIFGKVTLYNTRINSENMFVNSMPCTDCVEVIKFLNIKKVIYSEDNGINIMYPHDYKETYHTSMKKKLMTEINFQKPDPGFVPGGHLGHVGGKAPALLACSGVK
jgi:deoxycytidylate deaminase